MWMVLLLFRGEWGYGPESQTGSTWFGVRVVPREPSGCQGNRGDQPATLSPKVEGEQWEGGGGGGGTTHEGIGTVKEGSSLLPNDSHHPKSETITYTNYM